MNAVSGVSLVSLPVTLKFELELKASIRTTPAFWLYPAVPAFRYPEPAMVLVTRWIDPEASYPEPSPGEPPCTLIWPLMVLDADGSDAHHRFRSRRGSHRSRIKVDQLGSLS